MQLPIIYLNLNVKTLPKLSTLTQTTFINVFYYQKKKNEENVSQNNDIKFKIISMNNSLNKRI